MKLHRNEKYFKWGLTAFLVIVAAILFWIVFSNLSGFYDLILEFTDIISPVLFGCLFAYLMNPVMEFVRKKADKLLAKKTKWSDKIKARVSLIAGLTAAVIIFVAALYAIVALIVPNLISSLNELLQKEKLESYYQTIEGWFSGLLTGTGVKKWFFDNIDNVLQFALDKLNSIDIASIISGLTSSVYSVVMGVFNALLGIVAAVYILIYKKQLCSQTKKIVVSVFNAQHANRLFEIARRTNRIFGGYVIGKIMDAAIVGVVTYIAMIIMGLPYAPLIATLVGVTNIIPFFGPIIGAVPSVLLLLIERPINALYFGIFIIILQAIDGNILGNRILGEKLGISDLWVLVAILLFGGIFGVSGMLLGVPIFAVLYTLIADGVNNRLKRRRYPTDSDEYYMLKNVEDLPVEAAPSYSFVSVEPAYDMHAEPDDEDDYYSDYDE